MTVERIFHCDGPGCQRHGSDQYPGWIVIHDESGERHFCSWDCVMKYAARFPPSERIELIPPDEEAR